MTTRKLLRINNNKKIHFSWDDSFSNGEHNVGLACKIASEQVDSFTETPMTVDEFRQAIDDNKICKSCLRELLRHKKGRMVFVEWMIDSIYGDE
jgi:hypothetical protein